ncbi:unnamed protein product [Blumeria hordei]|uniref:Uncharacterized protein n=1 Tax=Blumeria hordei TaxID=2867405 RepID=A0A383UZ56_BLUHO|nr:unnamed protein product [Blumeria hordei]
MSVLLKIESEEAWEKRMSDTPSSTLQIIYFKTEWAAPCKQMTAVLETLASSYPVTDPPSTSWSMIDAEDLIDVSESFKVAAVPFVVLRRGTTIIESFSGNKATTIRAAIESNLNSLPAETGAPDPSPSNNAESKETDPTKLEAQDSSTVAEGTAEAENTKENLFKRLNTLVRAAPIMLFMKGTPSAPQCGFSRQLVELLRNSGVKYGFFNILADDAVRQGLKEFADWPTFPQLWAGGELVGGLDIVKEELATNPDFLKSLITNTTPAVETDKAS